MVTPMTKRARQRLGKVVLDRRVALGLTQSDLAGKGGPGQVTVGRIERAQIEPQPLTLARLDNALDWKAGSAARVLAGGDPEEISDAAQSEPTIPAEVGDLEEAIDRDPRLLPETRAHLRNQVELLLRIQGASPELLARQDDRRRAAARMAEVDEQMDALLDDADAMQNGGVDGGETATPEPPAKRPRRRRP